MDVFMKVLLLLSGLFFLYVGMAFFFRWRAIIQWVQKRKYGRTAEPRQQEKTVAKVVGIVLAAIGLYYAAAALVSFFL